MGFTKVKYGGVMALNLRIGETVAEDVGKIN